jgi:hypothetical protein
MQAGLATRRLTLREIFPSATFRWVSEKVGSGPSTVDISWEEVVEKMKMGEWRYTIHLQVEPLQ